MRISRDGSYMALPWLQALCLEGRMFGAQVGSASATITAVGTFGAGVIDLDEFDWLQTIPANVTCLPVYFATAFVGMGAVGETGLVLLYGAGGVINGGVTVTPYNLRPSAGVGSQCTIGALGADGGTVIVPTGVFFDQIATQLLGAATNPAQFVPEFSVDKYGFVPVLEGATQLAAFSPATAGTGFITAAWVELPSSAIE
ncbi:hypothetical protein LCGC14_0310710 [marine sediment metagenome]|uniref:Uncharacterized protein n=1 Tax=marine sediment metagenome TaxID=412755 RepID=A0A0F9WTT6_9ZZZZ